MQNTKFENYLYIQCEQPINAIFDRITSEFISKIEEQKSRVKKTLQTLFQTYYSKHSTPTILQKELPTTFKE